LDSTSGVFLVVGLGNPGMEYQFTPHNAGFLAIDRLAQRHGGVVSNRRGRSLTAKVRIGDRDVVLAKPETFMNRSGLAIEALSGELGIDPLRDLVVLYDELDLPLGRLQIKERGSPAGHNGAKSVAGALQTDEWLRIRIGVGPDLPDGSGRPGKDYLLSSMKKSDLAILDEVLDQAARAVEVLIAKGAGPAMNEFNRRE
jgi:PTH1 family peptidyl-tRNA hydrolase